MKSWMWLLVGLGVLWALSKQDVAKAAKVVPAGVAPTIVGGIVIGVPTGLPIGMTQYTFPTAYQLESAYNAGQISYGEYYNAMESAGLWA